MLSLLSKIGPRNKAALNMVETLGERLALCPASSRRHYHNSFPGGLVDHSLRVLGNAMRLCKAFEWTVPKESLIIAALFHDIGKCGFVTDEGEIVDYYLPQTDSYKAEKYGEEYAYNKELPYMTTPQRSVYMCQHFGLVLKKDEYLSILLNDGFSLEENKSYCLKIEPLVHVIMTADYIATMQEKSVGGWNV